MTKSYTELCKSAKYKLTGNGDRCIGLLKESFENVSSSSDADFYGNGDIINDFENEIALLLGKEAAIFFPSGTMAQQIALRIWSDEKNCKKVAYHPLCHLEIHEEDGLKELHHLEPILLGNKERIFTIEELKSIESPISCLLIELPQREIGGQLPTWDELIEITKYCKENSIKLHLDGARLFEVLPFYEKTASEICGLFDSAYISFYKGLGGIAGAMLVGNAEFMVQAKVWKRRHGGDLISLYPYIISAKHHMDKRVGKMKEYWQEAKSVAERFNQLKGIKTIPEIPVCNMFHAYINTPKETVESIFTGIIQNYDVCLIGNVRVLDESNCMAEFSFGDNYDRIPQEIMIEVFSQLKMEFEKL
jgi:threonine aldolase